MIYYVFESDDFPTIPFVQRLNVTNVINGRLVSHWIFVLIHCHGFVCYFRCFMSLYIDFISADNPVCRCEASKDELGISTSKRWNHPNRDVWCNRHEHNVLHTNQRQNGGDRFFRFCPGSSAKCWFNCSCHNWKAVANTGIHQIAADDNQRPYLIERCLWLYFLVQ